jgi:hypothetical protein
MKHNRRRKHSNSRLSISENANTYAARNKIPVLVWEYSQLGIWNSILKMAQEKTINNISENTGRISCLDGNLEWIFI